MLLIIDPDDDCVVADEGNVWQRLAARFRAYRLDRDLARGISPDGNALLALRAQALVRISMRRKLAGYLQDLLTEARGSRPVSRLVPVRQDSVRRASGELEALIDHLLVPAPVPACGVAQVRLLLTDGAGPLYYAGCPDDLDTRVHQAVEALDPLSNW
jgi:hypothetical protein